MLRRPGKSKEQKRAPKTIMRSASLLGLIAVLVIAGLLVKRQLTAVRMVAPPPTSAVEAGPGQPPITEQVRGAVDELMRQRQAELERADQAAD